MVVALLMIATTGLFEEDLYLALQRNLSEHRVEVAEQHGA